MGGGGWTAGDWDDFKSTTKGKPIEEVFTSRSMPKDMDPKKITVRESRDSTDHPEATPIILALDGTGSMGDLAHRLAQEGLGTLVGEILNRKPVSDPQIMAMAVGDVDHDRVPLQMTQFESDIRIAQQLKELYLEGGGGGNNFESYTLPWYAAALKTDIDSVAKRGKKGVLFTFGDEQCPPELTREQIKKVFGDTVQADISTADLLAMVQQKYDVFHVVVEQGNYAQDHKREVYKSWNSVLPQGHVIPLKDINKVAEVVTSVLEVHAGKDREEVAKSWDGSTAIAVREATKGMVKAGEDQGVWRPGTSKRLGGGGSGHAAGGRS